MLKKGVKGKSMKVILAGSLIGMGTFTGLPDGKAAEETGFIQEVDTKVGLSKLEIDGAKLNQGFSESILDYRATAENDVEKITLQAESRSGNATIFVNGTKLTNGMANLPLQTGMNTFEITVSDDVNETVTYTVKVEKLQSGDNHLTSIGLSQGSLAFDPNVTAYFASVENKVKSVTISPSLRDSNAHVMVNGMDAVKSGVKVELPIGETAVKIIVTAENGDERTYTLTLTRADVKKQEKEEADVKGQKQPAIEKPSSTEGDKPVTLSARSFNDQKPTSVSQTVKVAQPENLLTKKMSTGIDKGSATELLEKEDEAPVLHSLTASTGSWNKSFDSNEHTYHIEVNDDITSVELQGATGANGATIEYEGGNKKKVKLKNKAKTAISVTVSKDGKRRTYVLVFKKDIKVEMDEE
ncbi:cadherin-like beta sandwich domain-containing protein [Peribacillus muralis]|uniref:cadherin-like beta sandwich domain-containing protein n=1 Tax=Peribacillus muralis TaxID=264697 RepID=UPI0038038DE8